MDTMTIELTVTDGPNLLSLMMALFDTEHTRFVQFVHEDDPMSSWTHYIDHKLKRRSTWVRVTSVKRFVVSHQYRWRIEGYVPLDHKRLPDSESQTFVASSYSAHHRRGEAELGAEKPLCYQCGYVMFDCKCGVIS